MRMLNDPHQMSEEPDYDAFGNPIAQDLGTPKGAVATQAWDLDTGRLTRLAVDHEDTDVVEIDLK